MAMMMESKVASRNIWSKLYIRALQAFGKTILKYYVNSGTVNNIIGVGWEDGEDDDNHFTVCEVRFEQFSHIWRWTKVSDEPLQFQWQLVEKIDDEGNVEKLRD